MYTNLIVGRGFLPGEIKQKNFKAQKHVFPCTIYKFKLAVFTIPRLGVGMFIDL